jgi:hypothetical protein
LTSSTEQRILFLYETFDYTERTETLAFTKKAPPEPPELTYPRALYLEFRNDDVTSQFVITPEMVSDSDGTFVPLTMMHRQVSADKSGLSWRFRISSVSESTTKDSSGPLITQGDVKEALTYAQSIFKPISGFIASMQTATPPWTLYKTPLSVEIGPLETAAIAKKETPDGLIRRIGRARAEAGFDSSYWNETF